MYIKHIFYIVFIVLVIVVFLELFNTGSNRDKIIAGNKTKELFLDTVINYTPNVVIEELPDIIAENSGLVWYRDLFWTFNDSDGSPDLFAFDPQSGRIVQTIRIVNADNIDWEDIAQDEQYIYIGDVGNNDGSRTELIIYKVEKESIPDGKDGSVEARVIEYSYPEQWDYEPGYHNTNFDCEAFFCSENKIYLFTKNWLDRQTYLYTIPVTEGVYQAEVIDTFNADGLLTAADISPDKSMIALLGYKDYNPFLWLMEVNDNGVFEGNKIRLDMSSIYNYQTESVVFTSDDTIYFSSEISTTPHCLFNIPVSQWQGLLYK